MQEFEKNEITEAMVEELEEVVTPGDFNVIKGTGC